MSLQFIMGPSGSGKSHYLYQNVTKESLEHPEKNYLVIVPDQFTMQTQRDMVLASPRKGILNVDVLSFSRLAYRVFEEVGGNQRILLNDVGKSFVLRKVAGDSEEKLKILKNNLKKTGFIGEVKSIISEFTQYDVKGETLEKLLGEMKPAGNFYYKMQDIKTIYEGFQNYLADKYITGEELLDVFCQSVSKSKFLKNSIVVLDGFTGFTPVQNKLLRELMLVCEKVVVTITMSEHQKTNPLFELSEQTLESLTTIAKECKIPIEKSIYLNQKPIYRFKNNEALGFLEANLFRFSRAVYEKEQDAIQIYHAKNPREEVDFVAQQIRKLVRTQGMRYRDIAIITSDMDSYVNHVDNVFDNYEIPVFMDHKRSILLNSFVEYLRSFLDMAEQNFTYESVFRYLRTDLTGYTAEEIDVLENYCIALGIRGYKKWQETWIRRTKGMEEEELSYINEIRERFVRNIDATITVLKKRSKTVTDITRALHEFLVENELQKKVHDYEVMFGEAGELSLEKEYAQVYRIVMELFDQFVELLGDEKLSLKEYCQLLDAGLEEAKVGIIPPSLDQVLVGDIERTRIKDVKVIFFMGMNDAYLPGKMNGNGLLTERDREKFKANKIPLAKGAKEKPYIQKFYLYLIFTKPSKQLILTYSRASSQGTALRPAYLVFDLAKMFPKLKIQEVEKSVQTQEFSQKTGMSYLIDGLQNKKDGLGKEWQELYSWYKKNSEWEGQLSQIVEAAFYTKPQDTLTKKTAEKLYGKFLENSVTRLEKYSACAYAHFLTYGLKLQEREVYQFQAVDMGNLFHGAMEHFSKKLEGHGYTWLTLPEEQRTEFIEESVNEAIVNYENTILYSSARNEYTITRLKRMMQRSIWALTKQLEKGDFTPQGYELVYDSGVISLEDYNRMRLYGKIDRVDICETEDEVLVKIIDYKTGVKSFDLDEFYHGLQMQLVVYMNAAMEQEAKKHPEKTIVPAGVFYYRMKDPVIGKEDNEVKREQAILKELRLDGMANQDDSVLEHLDRTMEGQSLVIPVGKNKNGSLSKNSKVLSREEFEVLSEFAEQKMKKIGNEILKGESKISPFSCGDRTACDYCPYKAVCGFDEKISGYEYRKLEKFDSKDDVIARMRKEDSSWE